MQSGYARICTFLTGTARVWTKLRESKSLREAVLFIKGKLRYLPKYQFCVYLGLCLSIRPH
jgi:hypothetical protein